MIRVVWQEAEPGVRPRFIDVLENDEGLTDRLVVVEEDWDLLVDRVGLE